jgi:outer membrane lipoprotein-sorting protein
MPAGLNLLKLLTPTLCFLLLAATPAMAQADRKKMTDAEIASLQQSVAAAAKNIKSLTADFTQYKHMDFLTKDMESTGKLVFKQPDKMLLQYKKPYNYSESYINGKIHINDDGKKKDYDIGNSDVYRTVNKLIIGSVSGSLFNTGEFEVSYYKVGSNAVAVFVPHDPNLKKYMGRIELTFSPADASVTQVKIQDSETDFTRIVFKNRATNGQVEDDVFRN